MGPRQCEHHPFSPGVTPAAEHAMFTGIIENSGAIESLSIDNQGGRVTIHAPDVAPSLALANSIAVNGCCLTVVALDKERFSADLSAETIRKTSFGAGSPGLQVGTRVNLEQPLTAGKEFGGHFVLGHVDTVGYVSNLQREGDNWWYGVQVPEDFVRYIVPKGSLTVDGISLTVARLSGLIVEFAVIPFTYEHTNICDRRPGDAVNLEGDILGKYVESYLEARGTWAHAATCALTVDRLKNQGF
jgi:riboflavin synthase